MSSGELHALAQSCRHPSTPASELSNTANQINIILRQGATEKLLREEKQFLINDVVGALNGSFNELDATDLSRLAWLQIHLGDSASAMETVHRGLEIDGNNQYCQSLFTRLSNRP